MASGSLFSDFAVLQDQLRGLWRFKWQALIVAWCVALVFWAVIFLIPNKYEASAKIFVDSGTTLSQATKGISLNNDAQDQLDRMTAELLGTPQLRKVADETNLMAGAITAEQQMGVINGLRQNISIIADSKHAKGAPTLYTITYTDPNRARSLQVVDDLLNEFVEGSLTNNSEGSHQAEQFLTGQIEHYGRLLSSTEQRLADFKKRNLGLLPNEQGDYFAHLQAANSALRQLGQDLFVARREQDALAEELKSGQQFTSTTPAAPVSASGAAVLDTEQQIAQVEQRLGQMLLEYTTKYPGVVELEQTLRQLKARRQRELAAAKSGDVGAASALGLTANPVYQKVEEQYNMQQVKIASIEQEIVDRRAEIAKLKERLGIAPQVQAEYAQLARNYQVTKKQYDVLLARLDRTRLGQQAASTGLVKFQVIDPPSAGFKPVFPNRPLLIIGALIAALAAGAGVAYLLHLLRPVFVSARQLGAVTGLTVLGAVSLAWADQHTLQQRRGAVRYALWTGGLVALDVAVLILHRHISDIVRELRT